jgi:hypothetical protein
MTAPMRRPIGVTFIGVIGAIMGILHILGGVLVIIDRDDARLLHDSGMTQDQLLAAGIGAAIIGILVLMLAMALLGGSPFARLVFAFFVVLQVAGGVYALVAYNGEQQATGAVSLVLGLFVLFLLYGSEADREFFHGR